MSGQPLSHCSRGSHILLASPYQRGVGMVEVLIALVVISFGVLGMAGLQLTGMKQSANGFNRAKAVMLSENMATRMRINRSGFAAGLYTGFDSSQEQCATLPDPYCQASQDIDAERCNAAQLAAFDRYSIACGDRGSADSAGSVGTIGGINDLLPAGAKMLVSCNDAVCTEESGYTLSLEWTEGENASSDVAERVSFVKMKLKP